MDNPTLYQFSLCPFCNKVKAALDLKGISYNKVEVTPGNKKELPELPEGVKRKVPVWQTDDATVTDSTDILNYIESNVPGKMSFSPADPNARERAVEIEEWVDEQFTQALPTVIYGTWGEAAKAARVVAQSSNFGPMKRAAVQVGGSLIMHQIAKRILKRHNKTDAHGWVQENVEQFASWLGDKPFVTGSTISMGDVAMHGAITAVADFPIFDEIMERPTVKTWYDRVADLRAQNRAN